MKVIFLTVCLLLSACSVDIKSSQFITIKGLFDLSRKEALGRLWGLEYRGKRYEAYAVSKLGLVRFYTFGQLEVDLEGLFVNRIESFSLPNHKVLISNNKDGTKVIKTDNEELFVECEPFIFSQSFEYIQSCKNSDLSWQFSNTFKLNDAREIIYIQTYYSPRELPLIMWFNQTDSPK